MQCRAAAARTDEVDGGVEMLADVLRGQVEHVDAHVPMFILPEERQVRRAVYDMCDAVFSEPVEVLRVADVAYKHVDKCERTVSM